jgi:hypothetical protein
MKTLKMLAPMIVAALVIRPVDVRAQTPAEPALLYACYIPGLGVTYRIKEGNLPTACVSPKHVEFSWNQAGAKGDKGDKGDRGEPGASADVDLAGKQCPIKYFITGITPSGDLICRDAAGVLYVPPPPPPPPPPPAFDPSPYDGTWTVSPALTPQCIGSAASVVASYLGSLTGGTVKRTAVDELTFTPRLNGLVGGALRMPMVVPYREGTLVEVDVTVANFPWDVGDGSGTVAGRLVGSFTSTSAFAGSVSFAIKGDVRVAGFPLPVDVDCHLALTSFTLTKQ